MIRLFGFEVRFHVSFFVMAAILALPRRNEPGEIARSLSWLVVVTVSVLVHELGHAFAARGCGLQPRIELYSLGGLTTYPTDAALAHRHRIWISLAGPLAGFGLGGLVLAAQMFGLAEQGPVGVTAQQLVWANLGWGALNLLPMLPLDGGHVLREGVDALTRGRGSALTYAISLATAALAFFIALKLDMIWAAFIAGWSGVTAFNDWQRERVQQHDEQALRPRLELAAAATRRNDPETSIKLLQEVVQAARSDALREEAAVQLAWRQLNLGNVDEAQAALGFAPNSTRTAPLVVGTLLDAQGRYADAIPVLRSALASIEAGSDRWRFAAYRLVHAHVAGGDLPGALDWLRQHERSGADRELQSAIAADLFHAGHFAEAAALLEQAFAKSGTADDAYNVACTYARMPGRAADGLAWLDKAIATGYSDAQHLDADRDLDAVKALPGYSSVRAKLVTESKSEDSDRS